MPLRPQKYRHPVASNHRNQYPYSNFPPFSKVVSKWHKSREKNESRDSQKTASLSTMYLYIIGL